MVQNLQNDHLSGDRYISRSFRMGLITDLDEPGGEIILVVHWMGGIHTELRLPCRRRGQNSTAPEIIKAVRVLARVCSDEVIASLLNRNDLRTGYCNRWTRERVTSIRSHHKIPIYCHEMVETEG